MPRVPYTSSRLSLSRATAPAAPTAPRDTLGDTVVVVAVDDAAAGPPAVAAGASLLDVDICSKVKFRTAWGRAKCSHRQDSVSKPSGTCTLWMMTRSGKAAGEQAFMPKGFELKKNFFCVFFLNNKSKSLCRKISNFSFCLIFLCGPFYCLCAVACADQKPGRGRVLPLLQRNCCSREILVG